MNSKSIWNEGREGREEGRKLLEENNICQLYPDLSLPRYLSTLVRWNSSAQLFKLCSWLTGEMFQCVKQFSVQCEDKCLIPITPIEKHAMSACILNRYRWDGGPKQWDQSEPRFIVRGSDPRSSSGFLLHRCSPMSTHVITTHRQIAFKIESVLKRWFGGQEHQFLQKSNWFSSQDRQITSSLTPAPGDPVLHSNLPAHDAHTYM